MKRIFAIAALLAPLALVSTDALALNCSGGRYVIIVNDGSTIGREVCAGGTSSYWPNWFINWFM
jgi:hypothetical protein